MLHKVYPPVSYTHLDRHASRDLSDILLTQLQRDIRSTFNVDWTRPVSYTHLDVYKRQPMLTQLINARILTPQGWLKDGSVPVSYTHLDVYKRQVNMQIQYRGYVRSGTRYLAWPCRRCK